MRGSQSRHSRFVAEGLDSSTMRLSGFLQYGAILIGVIAMFAGQFFATPKSFHLGLFLVGLGVAAGGLEAIFMRQLSLRVTGEASAENYGAPAVLWGILVLIAGASAVLAAYLLSRGLGIRAIHGIASHPETGLAATGVFFGLAGALLVMDRRHRGATGWARLLRFTQVFAGSALAATGAAAMMLGAWAWTNPSAFERLLRAFAAAVS